MSLLPTPHTEDLWGCGLGSLSLIHVAKPSETPLVEDGVHAVHVEAFLNFCVLHFALPLDAQDTPQPSQVEATGFPLMQ